PSASALLVALHAAHHGPNWRKGAQQDIERAAAKLDQACWTDARHLAVELHAERAMGVGLGLTDGGHRLAEQLGLDPTPTRALELLWSGAPWSATFVDALLSDRSIRWRLHLATRVLI